MWCPICWEKDKKLIEIVKLKDKDEYICPRCGYKPYIKPSDLDIFM